MFGVFLFFFFFVMHVVRRVWHYNRSVRVHRARSTKNECRIPYTYYRATHRSQIIELKFS